MSNTGEETSGADLFNRLADEFVARFRRGERPSLSEYSVRHPELAREIQELFPALAEIEQFGVGAGPPTEHVAGPVFRTQPAPERLGDFRIVREIARGGMGIVYEALQESLGRHVALKVMPQHSMVETRHQERFRREARAAALLHHTNIVPVFSVGECDGALYYAMQYIKGQSLDIVLNEVRRLRGLGASNRVAVDRARPDWASNLAQGMVSGEFSDQGPSTFEDLEPGRPGAPSPAEPPAGTTSMSTEASSITGHAGLPYYHAVARIAAQAAEGLSYAHHQKLLHRDIKPSNLLLDLQGTLWVTDFGLVKVEENEALTRTGDIVGTVRYIAPERFRGQTDVRSDVYALGLTLYEMLTLTPAFAVDQRPELIHKILHEEPPRPRQIDAGIPRDLETIALKATAKDPSDRYQSAADLAEDLRRFLSDQAILARQATLMDQARRWCRRSPALAIAMCAAASALVAVAILAVLYADRERRLAIAQEHASLESRSQAIELKSHLDGSNRLLANRNFDRAQAAFEKEQVGPGLLWMVESWRAAAAANDFEMERAARANISAWLPFQPRLEAVFSHARPVEQAVFSPDGKLVATAGDDAIVRFWDVATGRTIGPTLEHEREVTDVAFSPDGKLLLTGTMGGICRLWEISTGTRLGPERAHKGSGELAVAFSRDGKTFVSGRDGGTLQLWDTATRESLSGPFPNLGLPVDFTPDGRSVLMRRGPTPILDPRTGQANTLVRTVANADRATAMSPNGKMLAIGNGAGEVRLLDPSTGKLLRPVIQAHSHRVRDLAISPDGSLLLTGSTDKSAHLWDLATGEPIGLPYLHDGPVVAVTFSPDGTLFLTTSSDYTVRLWRVEVHQPVQRVFESAGLPAALSQDGRLAATTAGDRDVRIREVRTGRLIGPTIRPKSDPVAVAFSPDGNSLATVCQDRTLRLWDVSTGSQTGGAIENPEGFISARFRPDGMALFAICKDRTVRAWDVATHQLLGGTPSQADTADSMAISPDGATLLIGFAFGEARLWDVRSWKPIGKAIPFPGDISVAEFSPDGESFVLAGEDGTARIFDTASGSLRLPPLSHGTWVWHAVFSRDGATLLTCTSMSLRLWDTGTGRPIGPPLKLPRASHYAAFCIDENHLFVAMTNGTSRLLTGPARLDEDLGIVADRIESLTGMTVDPEQGSLRFFDNAAWLASRDHAQHRVSPPKAEVEPQADPFSMGVELADRGDALFSFGWYTEAEAAFNELVRKRPQNTSSWVARGNFLTARGRDSRAMADFEVAVATDPEDPQLHYRLAIARLVSGDVTGYRHVCEAMLRRFDASPSPSPFAANRLAYACIYSPDALSDPSRLVRLAVDSVSLFAGGERIVGAALYRAGRYEEALIQFDRSRQAFQPVAWDWLFLAMIQGRLGHMDVARQMLARARQAIADADSVKSGTDQGEAAGWGNTYERSTIMLLVSEAESIILYGPAFPDEPFAP